MPSGTRRAAQFSIGASTLAVESQDAPAVSTPLRTRVLYLLTTSASRGRSLYGMRVKTFSYILRAQHGAVRARAQRRLHRVRRRGGPLRPRRRHGAHKTFSIAYGNRGITSTIGVWAGRDRGQGALPTSGCQDGTTWSPYLGSWYVKGCRGAVVFAGASRGGIHGLQGAFLFSGTARAGKAKLLVPGPAGAAFTAAPSDDPVPSADARARCTYVVPTSLCATHCARHRVTWPCAHSG